MKICAESNLNLYIASTQTTKLLEKMLEKPVRPILIGEYVDYLTPLEKVFSFFLFQNINDISAPLLFLQCLLFPPSFL